jgi:hypothetical protein
VAKVISPKFRKYMLIFMIAIAVVCLPIFIEKAPRIFSKLSQAAQRVEKFIKWDFNPGITVTVNQETQTSELPKLRSALATGPLRVSSDNPRYFVDSSTGKIVYLTGTHTWSNLQDNGLSDPPPVFNYSEYLDFLVANNHNFFRLWTWEEAKWYTDTTKDYWFEPLPYFRGGQELAKDGKPKFDLTKFNQLYFDRLRQRVSEAKKRNIYVSIMLFNGWSIEDKTKLGNPWQGHPYHRDNNINQIDGDLNRNERGEETHTLEIPAVTSLQEAYVKKVIDTVNDLDNVLYEISNESSPGSHQWQYHLINYIKTYEKSKPKQHPVGMTVEWPEGDNSKLFDSPADWISLNGDINNPPIADGSKVILADTDHICGICGDRSWVWKSFTRGENPIFMDVYDGAMPLVEPPIPPNPLSYEPWVSLRRNLGYTLTYANRMNLAAMKPHPELVSTGYCLANLANGKAEYLIYVPLGEKLTVDLSTIEGTISGEWLNPSDGLVTTGITIAEVGRSSFIPPFEGDAVLYLRSN